MTSSLLVLVVSPSSGFAVAEQTNTRPLPLFQLFTDIFYFQKHDQDVWSWNVSMWLRPADNMQEHVTDRVLETPGIPYTSQINDIETDIL